MILAQSHGLIRIKNPSYSSPPIRFSRAPHYPTRRPIIGTLVTCPAYDQGKVSRQQKYEAMVIAIERNHWPREWRYLIRLEQLGKPPKPHTAILDRGLLNPSDDLHYIRPEVATFRDNDVAFFFNAFEQVLQVTIIQKVEPSSHETVRMSQTSSRNRSPSMTIQTIESHRLFTQEMLSHYEETGTEEMALAMTPQQVTPHRLKDVMESIPLLDYNNPTTLGQRGPPLAPDTMDPDSTEGQERPTMSDRVGEKRKTSPSDGGTVVLQSIRKIHSLHSSFLISQTTIVVFKINSSFIFFQNYYLTILKLLE